MTRPRSKSFFPILIFFMAINGLIISGRTRLLRWHADQDVLLVGNVLLFLVTVISFMMAQRSLAHSNPNVFVRAIYGSVMLKLFVCMIAAFIYIAVNKTGLNKPALLTCMALYLIYTFMEVAALTKMLKGMRNA